MKRIKIIRIIGPESTGKSTLCEQLAKHYTTLWCPEYAREYLLRHGTNYTYNDLLHIARGQFAVEESFMNKMQKEKNIQHSTFNIQHRNSNSQQTAHHSLLFTDTDMNVMKVWCEYVFGKCFSFILEKTAEQKTDLFLLCNIDLPWEKDELREYPDLKQRKELFHMYRDILINQDNPWAVVSGNYEHRLQTAIAAIDALH